MRLSNQTIEGIYMTGIGKERVVFMVHCMFNHRVWKGTFFNSLIAYGSISMLLMVLSLHIPELYTLMNLFYISVYSFVEVTKYLLEQTGVQFILSERFNQDPLESHFGKHRQMKGGNENPTVAQFNYNENNLRLLGSQALAPVRGNCKRSVIVNKIDDTPLPKKPRKPEKC